MQRKPKRSKKPMMPTMIYEFEITLLDIEPRIWRRFAMSGNMGLKNLHSVIQIVMGWEDYHLHSFEIGNKTYAMDEADWMDYGDTPDGIRYESGFRIRGVLDEGDQFTYQYDFGDNWQHSIKVVHIGAPKKASNTRFVLLAPEPVLRKMSGASMDIRITSKL